MEPTTNVLTRIETELARSDSSTMRRWSRACPLLASAKATHPSDVPSWVLDQPRDEANQAIASLVRLAQDGDQAALLTVILCLRPGLLKLAWRLPVSLDDIIAEATIRVLEFPVARRRNIVGGLVLDIRHAIWAPACRRRHVDAVPTDPGHLADTAQAPGDANAQPFTAAERLIALIHDAWRAGHLNTDRAQLLIETRVLGDQMQTAADRRGVSRKAMYVRRDRAEARLTDVYAAV